MEKDKCDFCGNFTYCSRIKNSDAVICASCVFPNDLSLEVHLETRKTVNYQYDWTFDLLYIPKNKKRKGEIGYSTQTLPVPLPALT